MTRDNSRSLFFYLNRLFAEHSAAPPPRFYEYIRSCRIPFLKYRSLKPNHFNDRLMDLAKNTSPGTFFKQKGYKTKKEALSDPRVISYCRSYAHSVKTKKHWPTAPASMLVPTTSKLNLETGEVKTRIAFVFDLRFLCIENMFFSAIKDVLPDDYVPTPENCHSTFCGGLGYDFKSFDTSVPWWLKVVAFYLLFEAFDFSEYAQGGIPKSRYSLVRLFKFVQYVYLNTPFTFAQLAKRVHTRHGVPSGGMLTNVLDTIISRLVIHYLHAARGCYPRIKTYGDDCHTSKCDCDASILSSECLRLFKMNLKIEHGNEHGCLTYCKVECHMGQGFRSGVQFANILNTCQPQYRSLTAYCCTFLYVTQDQCDELKGLFYNLEIDKETAPDRILKILEFSPTKQHPTDL